jgi:hypothetical protein
LKTLPIGTIYKDPRNNYSYQVQEKKFNENLVKNAVAYFGELEPITIDVPPKHMKLEHPQRTNIMVVMKDKITNLEQINQDLLSSKSSSSFASRFQQIKQLLGEKNYFETDDHMYFHDNDGIVYYIPKKGKSRKELFSFIRKYIKSVWKNPHLLNKIVEKQD